MADIVARSCTFDLGARTEGMPDDVVPAVISTDAPVAMSMGGKRVLEILDHSQDSVDLSRFPLPLVEDHDNASTALAVAEEPKLEGGKLRTMIRFGSQARAREILADVKAGIIRSLSVFYERMVSVRENDSTIRTKKWLPMHVSPVGTPADAGAGFFRSEQPGDEPNNARKAPMADDTNKPDVKPVDETAVRSAARTEVIAEAKEIAGIARSLSLPAEDFIGMDKAAALKAIGDAVTARAKEGKPDPKTVAIATTIDHADKQVDAVADAMLQRCGFKASDGKNPYAGRTLCEMATKYAKSIGVRAADDWSRKDAAHFVLGENSMVSGMRDAANITTGSFPNFVFLNAMTKVVAKGFEMAGPGLRSVNGNLPYDTQKVPDFKTFYVGGLGTANLQETAENTPFPELVKTEGVYSDTAKMWGGTLTLSLQALISDDTASFDRSLRQVGAIAQKTIDRRIVQKLLMGSSASTGTSTWTSNTSSGTTIVYTTADTAAAARKNLGIGNKDLQLKVGLDGNPTGNMARFLICGPTNGLYAMGLFGVAPGQPVLNSGGYELVQTPWLENSSLTGNSTTTYYLVADPMLVTGLILTEITGYESIQVQEYDAGAVGARKWKFWKPFEADLFKFTNASSTTIIPGAQQCTT